MSRRDLSDEMTCSSVCIIFGRQGKLRGALSIYSTDGAECSRRQPCGEGIVRLGEIDSVRIV